MSPYFQREDDQYVEQLKSQANNALLVVQSMTKERDALARRVAELEAALASRDHMWCAALLHLDPREIASVTKRFLDFRDGKAECPWADLGALASSGGTGAATRLVDWRKCIDCGHEWPFPSETSYLRCPPCSRSGLREIVERAVRLGINLGHSYGDTFDKDEVDAHTARVLAGERDVVRRSFETLAATRDERATENDGDERGPAVAAEDSFDNQTGQQSAHATGGGRSPSPTVALPSREQAGRADSSGGASDRERAQRILRDLFYRPNTEAKNVDILAAEFAAIRREAVETSQAERRVIEAAVNFSNAGDAPAERGE